MEDLVRISAAGRYYSDERMAAPSTVSSTGRRCDARDAIDSYPESTFMNFTSMHEICNIISKLRLLAEEEISDGSRPTLPYFKSAAESEDPCSGLELFELPFSVYLITGNAGSGKSTCLQTIYETMDCVMTGTTKVASQNVYGKLSASYTCQHINTIFHEFGFKTHHVQMTTGKWQYSCKTNPPTIGDLQKRDLVYYWEVISDITKNVLEHVETVAAGAYAATGAAEKAMGLERGSLGHLAYCINVSIPAFARTNVVVIDEAGLLGRHILTSVVYGWWLINCAYETPQYLARKKPLIVCVGSPTQTSSLESTFEHSALKCKVRTSENVLSFIICNKTLRNYLNVSSNWSIFINNKRCTEPEFGELLKYLEYGLSLTEDHARLADSFVVPEAFINNPANLPGWTRLYTSHKEVSAYMTRLHSYLKVTGDERFTVFTLPSYTLISLEAFEQYKKAADQPNLTLERWTAVNAGRLSNWSQSRDQDAVQSRCEIRSDLGLAIARSEVTYVINSQVSVTARLKKWMFGFCDTFEGFMLVLKDDAFVKTHGEGSVEYAYKFLSHIIFNGMINFYDFLLDPSLNKASVEAAYASLADVTRRIVPGMDFQKSHAEESFDVPSSGRDGDDTVFNFSALNKAPDGEDDAIFSALNEKTVDLLYCNYDMGKPESPVEVHAQMSMLKSLFLARYSILGELFGKKFYASRFDSYVSNVTFKRGEMFTHGIRGGMLSLALQTDTYTLVGHTKTTIPAFSEECARHKKGDNVLDAMRDLNMPLMVLKDQRGFMSIININVNDFVDNIDDVSLKLATTADYGISSKLSMTIARSQGLSLEKVAICFPRTGLRLNTVYVAMSRVTSSEFLRMNLNPLRENYIRDDDISEYILSALRDPSVHIVY